MTEQDTPTSTHLLCKFMQAVKWDMTETYLLFSLPSHTLLLIIRKYCKLYIPAISQINQNPYQKTRNQLIFHAPREHPINYTETSNVPAAPLQPTHDHS